jgi:hypothetical protein
LTGFFVIIKYRELIYMNKLKTLGVNIEEYLKTVDSIGINTIVELLKSYNFEVDLNHLLKKEIIIFSESWCMDCKINVTILNEIFKQNGFKNVRYLKREKNEELLYELSNDKRIPTMLLMSEGKVEKVFIERPKKVNDIFENDKRHIVENMEKYKKGEYIDFSIEALVKFLSRE